MIDKAKPRLSMLIVWKKGLKVKVYAADFRKRLYTSNPVSATSAPNYIHALDAKIHNDVIDSLPPFPKDGLFIERYRKALGKL